MKPHPHNLEVIAEYDYGRMSVVDAWSGIERANKTRDNAILQMEFPREPKQSWVKLYNLKYLARRDPWVPRWPPSCRPIRVLQLQKYTQHIQFNSPKCTPTVCSLTLMLVHQGCKEALVPGRRRLCSGLRQTRQLSICLSTTAHEGGKLLPQQFCRRRRFSNWEEFYETIGRHQHHKPEGFLSQVNFGSRSNTGEYVVLH